MPVSISLGPLTLTYLLAVGGAGYFRISVARPFLADGRMRLVAGEEERQHGIGAQSPI